jgi:2-oxoglutarate dehydrogenase E1 component
VDETGFGPNTWLVDELRARYAADPGSVDPSWRSLFDAERAAGSPSSGNGKPVDGPEPGRPVADTAPAAEAAPVADAGTVPDAGTAPAPDGADVVPLTGSAAVIARRMEESLDVPTATSVRTVPAKLLELNRRLLNRHLERIAGRRISFTHLVAFAVVRALAATPAMRRTYAVADGAPGVADHPHVNLGIAIDVRRRDGSRTLLVPNIRSAETLDFAAFASAYDDVVDRAHTGALSADDLAGTIVTLTNPGVVGTVQSVPRLMAGQAAIVGLGAIAFPAEYEGADASTLADLGVSKVVTLTNTYDHRVIQGAESGEFLGRVRGLLLGDEEFYGSVFAALDVPYRPIHWTPDSRPRQDSAAEREKQAKVLEFINNYRVRGHLIADLDPLATAPPPTHPDLDPANLGFSIWDVDRSFVTGGLGGTREATLQDIWDTLRDAYCGTLAVEYMHIQDPARKRWIQERVEHRREDLGADDRRRILHELNEAEALERFLHTRYVGHKRFSLEGAESLIPMLDAILDLAADGDVSEIVMGMAHRGRLNVLANVIGKAYAQIFREFEGNLDPNSVEGTGDVKYHLGSRGRHTSPAGNGVDVTLASNPSHLESVDPVVEGIVRAKQDRSSQSALPLLIHGEAAFAGQGVVAETLALSQLPGYATDGTIHVIVNNQLGFTTPPKHGRSSTYPSDVAKAVQAPILHVNGDDPEACVRAARLAFAFRREFATDVVIDLWCYRRWGHNEADEPSFTQPLMYRRIADLPSVRTRYAETLVRRGDLSAEEVEATAAQFSALLARAFEETRESDGDIPSIERRDPASPGGPPEDTGVSEDLLRDVLEAVTSAPADLTVHPKLERWLERRASALADDRVDWATAEALALGSLLREGATIRLTGQDTRRGTFSQRHAVLVDQRTGAEYLPLEHVGPGRAFVYDSPLSEFAALGFEYGYSVGDADALVMWEAQFGDFVNGAQVVLDQYLAAAEDKWGQTSRLVLLLPHGYEGQGPEHSSARLERFLELAAERNLGVAVPSTPAQYFHLLRRQALTRVRKPLVVLTPKSLLRASKAVSGVADLTSGAFRPVLGDPAPAAEPFRVLVCQGKLFYDLLQARGEDVALLRLERCYPFPSDELREELSRYPHAEVVWAQEEPENMGAARFVVRNMHERLGIDVRVVARPESASPATGSLTVHDREQAELVRRALSREDVRAARAG